MVSEQKYGIKYPFESENLDEVYLDLNDSYSDNIKSQVLHILFTPKGQRLRDPQFGTDLIKYLFEPNDSSTLDGLKSTIRNDISAYIPNVVFDDIDIIENPEGNEHERFVSVSYRVKTGNKEVQNNIAVKI